jgi:hypothetical protein
MEVKAMAQLRYNPATGVWMPPLESRPRQHQFAQPAPLTRNQPYFRQIPIMPNYPNRPRRVRMSALPGNIRDPRFGNIPNRPVINQPNLPNLPKDYKDKSKWGQYTLTNTVPEPSILPKPNLPNMTKFNASYVKRGQSRINQKMRYRGGGVPEGAKQMRGMVRARKVKPSDLGINKTKGSNSQLLNFGSYLGRSVGSPL